MGQAPGVLGQALTPRPLAAQLFQRAATQLGIEVLPPARSVSETLVGERERTLVLIDARAATEGSTELWGAGAAFVLLLEDVWTARNDAWLELRPSAVVTWRDGLPTLQLACAEALTGVGFVSALAGRAIVGHWPRMGRSPRPLSVLTRRERETLQALVDGLTLQETATRLDLAVKTIEVHRGRLYQRLGVDGYQGALRLVGMHPELLEPSRPDGAGS
jgi:DNA-binding CsgD family transcriptional regulator